VDLVSRSDFSTEQINGIADQLEGAWKVLGGQKPQQQLLVLLNLPLRRTEIK